MVGGTRMGPGTDPEDGLDEGRADLGLRDEAHLAQQQLQVRSVNPKNLQRVDRSAIGVDSDDSDNMDGVDSLDGF